MLRRLVLALLLAAASNARALEFTDVYFDPTESGWGAFLVQSHTLQFIAFFIYGSDGKPTWYTAQLIDDGTGQYKGPLYATTGTSFALPWNPSQVTVTSVGNATFHPIDLYHATLTYTVTGVAMVTKTIQRLPLASYPMAGRYSGSMAGSISGCNDPSANDPAFRGRYVVDVTQDGDSSATLTFTFVDTLHNGIVCAVSGPLAHFGRIYQMPNAAMRCTGPGQDGAPYSVTIDSFHPTGQGIEGKLSARVGGACSASLHFSAVLNVNN